MKTLITKIKQVYIRTRQWIIGWFLIFWEIIKYIGIWIANFYLTFISPTSKPRIFKGFGHWWLAKKYADKRSNLTKVNKLCGGKRHYVLPYGEESLIVINRLELINGKNKGLFNRNMNIDRIIKQSYYITQ